MYHKTDSPKFRVILILPVLSGIMWGSGGVFVRRFDAMGMDNFTMLFTRIIVSVTLLGIGLFLYDRSLLKIRLRDLWVFLGGGILGMFGINLTYNEAIKHGTLALASVLLSMSPLFVVTFSVLFFHEKMTLQKGICHGRRFARLCTCKRGAGKYFRIPSLSYCRPVRDRIRLFLRPVQYFQQGGHGAGLSRSDHYLLLSGGLPDLSDSRD